MPLILLLNASLPLSFLTMANRPLCAVIQYFSLNMPQAVAVEVALPSGTTYLQDVNLPLKSSNMR